MLKMCIPLFAQREMAEEKYEESYFIIQQHDEDGIFY